LVDKEFFIKGRNIFDIGFRPGLVFLADEVGVKVHATNLRDKRKIRVIASGSHESVNIYYDTIKGHKVPIIFGSQNVKYDPTQMKEDSRPDIDWQGYNQQFMSAQPSKTMFYSNEAFGKNQWKT
jgi:acylphosphatase